MTGGDRESDARERVGELERTDVRVSFGERMTPTAVEHERTTVSEGYGCVTRLETDAIRILRYLSWS